MKVISLITFSLISLIGWTQSVKEVDNGIFVEFPTQPEYSVKNDVGSFQSKTSNCFYMVLIQRGIIPNYDKYVIAKKNWSSEELKKVEDSFLDNAIKGKLEYSGSKGEIEPIKIGNYSGRKLSQTVKIQDFVFCENQEFKILVVSSFPSVETKEICK
jgi:hypothetical protein